MTWQPLNHDNYPYCGKNEILTDNLTKERHVSKWHVKGLVGNTRLNGDLINFDMLQARNDATLVIFSLNGMEYGAHVVEGLWGLDQEHQNTKAFSALNKNMLDSMMLVINQQKKT